MARARSASRTSSGALFAAVVLAALGGCHSVSSPTPENYTKGISKYLLDHPDCLYKTALRFPYETSDAAEIRQLDSLVGAQLLSRQEERSIHVSRYTVTDVGAKSAPRFCFGFRHIMEIVNSTPPAKAADGFNESQVTYRYRLEDVPVWAKTPAVQTAYPKMAEAISGPSTATLTLAQTGVGWQVPQ